MQMYSTEHNALSCIIALQSDGNLILYKYFAVQMKFKQQPQGNKGTQQLPRAKCESLCTSSQIDLISKPNNVSH